MTIPTTSLREKNDLKLLVVGTGPDEKELRELANRDKRIIFMGNSTQPLDYYQMAVIGNYQLAQKWSNRLVQN